MDLFDIVTARKLSGGGGGGGTTVEALSVTQNGTYTAPSGKAYSPVTVNVSGGSSDFSTAEVQVKSESTGHSFFITSDYDTVTGLVSTEEGYFTDTSLEQIDVGVTYTLNVLILNGSFMISYVDHGNISANNISTTGSATVQDLGGFVEIHVTGDCTITIS